MELVPPEIHFQFLLALFALFISISYLVQKTQGRTVTMHREFRLSMLQAKLLAEIMTNNTGDAAQ